MNRLIRICLLISLLTLNACSLNKMTGDMMTSYTKDHLTPYLLGSQDLEMACEMGVSMGPYLLSFERVTDSPDEVAISTLMTAALCAEQRSWDEELRALRAQFHKNVAEAKDAMIAQKRAHALAALRYYQSYERFLKVFAEDRCPNEDEELSFLMGLISGVQAVQHDRASVVSVGVPADIPANVARKTKCLDNDKWFGVPSALQAAVWLVIPGSAPAEMEKDQQKPIFDQLQKATEIGNQKGLRIAGAIFANAALSKGNLDLVKSIISKHAESLKQTPSFAAYKLLDQTSTLQIQSISDKIWTSQIGSRTPHQELGTFWVDPSQPKKEDANQDLLEGL